MRLARPAGLLVAVAALVAVAVASVLLGSRDVGVDTIWHALTAGGAAGPADETVIREMRIPRTLIGIAAGAALGLAGGILQGATRNPLADPGILGINGGAAAAIVLVIAVTGRQSLPVYIWFAFAGAGLAMLLVYSVAAIGREGATPTKLALAGAAISAGLGALVTAIVTTDLDAFNEMRFWQVGSLAGRYWPVLWQTLPFLAIGSVLALLAGRTLNTLALGDDVASSLGQNVRRSRLLLLGLVAVMCGAAVSACGPIVFLGLAVPQLVRAVIGPDYRWGLAFTAVLAPVVLLAADILGRVLAGPAGELQAGIVLGVLGAPVFVLLVRSRRVAAL